jgi:hypothetical protein
MDKFGNLSDLQKILWIERRIIQQGGVAIKSKQANFWIQNKRVFEEIFAASNSYTNNR